MTQEPNEIRCNPEIAEEMIANIFSRLYESWPVEDYLAAEEITGIEYDEGLVCIDSVKYPVPQEWKVFEGLIPWLIDEKYIRVAIEGGQYGFARVTLTSKALEVLKKVPGSLEADRQSYMDIMKNAFKDGSVQARNQAIKMITSSLYKAIVAGV